jgi:hypothetical protein
VDFIFSVTATDTSGATGAAQVTVSVKQVNRLPTLTGGTVAEVKVGATVTLDGGTAADPDNDTLTYAWTQISGPTVTLTGATNAHPTFTAPNVSNATVLGFDATIGALFALVGVLALRRRKTTLA